jgi:hypothetical protein
MTGALFFLAGGRVGGGVAGDGEEHVIEVGAVDRQVLDVDAGVVKLAEQPAQRGDAAVAGDLQDQLIVVRHGVPACPPTRGPIAEHRSLGPLPAFVSGLAPASSADAGPSRRKPGI